MERHFLTLIAVLSLGLPACAGSQTGSRSDRIEGQIIGEEDGEPIPLGTVAITIVPVGHDTDCMGVAVSNYAGRFLVDQLSDRSLGLEMGLLRNQEYRATFMVPHYYTTTTTFTYERGSQDLQVVLVRKDSVLNEGGLPQLEADNNDPLRASGSVRRGDS